MTSTAFIGRRAFAVIGCDLVEGDLDAEFHRTYTSRTELNWQPRVRFPLALPNPHRLTAKSDNE